MKSSITIKSALIVGIINCIVWYAVARQMGFYSDKYYLYRLLIMYIFILIAIPLTIFLNKKDNNGFIEFKEALKMGMLFSVIFVIVMAVFNYIYHTIITPDTVSFFCSDARKYAIANHKTPNEIIQAVEGQKNSLSSFRLVPPALFCGLIASLLAGAILQKNNPNKPIAD
jgi:hypothetical protein